MARLTCEGAVGPASVFIILDCGDLSCLSVASMKTADRRVRFWPPSAVAAQPPATLESLVRTPQQEEYEEEMHPLSPLALPSPTPLQAEGTAGWRTSPRWPTHLHA